MTDERSELIVAPLRSFRTWLIEYGVSPDASELLTLVLALGAVLLLCIAANYLAKQFVLVWMQKMVSRSRGTWDDLLMQRKVFHRLSHLAPALTLYFLSPYALSGHPHWAGFTAGAAQIYIILAGLLVADAALNAFLDIYEQYPASKEIPIRGFVQVVKIVVYLLGAILTVSIVVGKNPIYLLSGLGALTAVLMLIFKDPILGFVAGIQLTGNKMVAVGDWIEMPKYNADGDVMEVALTTVKVRNWDKTITTIPTYALISDSFKNWRGMSDSGGRRIKRAVYIDMQTIRFCTEDMLKRFSRIAFIAEYIEQKKQELAQYNAQQDADLATLANGRRLTNIGTFRAYVVAYLRHHPMINQSMTFLVRQLAPTDRGLPLEVYVFSKDKIWANYEAIQADIFDHILAVVTEFDLRVFQSPGGSDFRQLSRSGMEPPENLHPPG